MGITSDMKLQIEEKYEKAFRNYFPESRHVDVTLKRHTLLPCLIMCLKFTYELDGSINEETILQDDYDCSNKEPFNLDSFAIEFYKMMKRIKGVNNRVW